MIYQVLQNKGDKTTEAAINARMFGEVNPIDVIRDYKIVCEIEADDMDQVFEIGNIGPESKINRLDRMHSVSVGDIIRDDRGLMFVVSSFGFTRLGEKEAA